MTTYIRQPYPARAVVGVRSCHGEHVSRSTAFCTWDDGPWGGTNIVNSPSGPLNGLRVIELGSIVAASFAAQILGDLGAEVIKIEAPGKLDPLREWGQGLVWLFV